MTVETRALERGFPEALADSIDEAVGNTFEVICGERPVLQQGQMPDRSGPCVIGVISFVGDFSWSYCLGLPEATAPALAQSFAGFEIAFDSPDMGDLVGELANVLGGNMISSLGNRGVRSQIGLPSVLRGSDIQTLLPKAMPKAHYEFHSSQGTFWLEVAASPA
jgi:CheY-specific phosphatase CheX